MNRFNKKGFTLIELLAVVTIVGILMMLAIPSVSRTIEKSRKKTFLDIAKTYANAAKNLWTADAVLCGSEYQQASSMVDGEYFMLIDTSSDVITQLTEKNPKSPWGGGDLKGYVRITKAVDGDQATKYYVALTDGRHAIYDDPDNQKEVGLLGDEDILQDISQNEELLKAIQEIPFENGKYTTCSEESVTWTGNTPFGNSRNGNIVVVSGNGTNVGDEVCIGSECFYVISSDDDKVTMLAKYNLYVGGSSVNQVWTPYGAEATGMQDSTMLGWVSDRSVANGVTAYSSDSQKGVYYGSYNGSIVEGYVNNYKQILENNFGVNVLEARIIKSQDIVNNIFKCEEGSPNYCINSPYPWIYSVSYWTSTLGYGTASLWFVRTDKVFIYYAHDDYDRFGVRPVIVIPIDQLN